MKNKYLYIAGIVILGAIVLIYRSINNEPIKGNTQVQAQVDNMPKANITVRPLGVLGFPLKVSVDGVEQTPNEKNIVEIEKAGANVKLEITTFEDTNIQLVLNKRTKDTPNGKCGAGIKYTSVSVDGENVISESALQSDEPAIYVIPAKQDNWFKVSASWDKATAEPDCIGYYTFNNPIEDIEITGLFGIENWGRWSDGDVAEFNFTNLPQQNLTIAFSVHPFLGGKKVEQNVTILANDEPLTKWHFESGQSAPDTTLNISADKIKDGKLKITFEFEDPISPKDAGVNNGTRKLGLGFRSMAIKVQK